MSQFREDIEELKGVQGQTAKFVKDREYMLHQDQLKGLGMFDLEKSRFKTGQFDTGGKAICRVRETRFKSHFQSLFTCMIVGELFNPSQRHAILKKCLCIQCRHWGN